MGKTNKQLLEIWNDKEVNRTNYYLYDRLAQSEKSRIFDLLATQQRKKVQQLIAFCKIENKTTRFTKAADKKTIVCCSCPYRTSLDSIKLQEAL